MQAAGTPTSWAHRHFADADLGDARRAKRLTKMAAKLAADPEASLPEAHDGWAELTGSYRLLNNDAVEPRSMLAPHARLTREAMAEHEVVLCVQDTCHVDFNNRDCEGLGEIGNGLTKGLLQHAGLAVTEGGDVLGLLDCLWHTRIKAPEDEPRNQRSKRWTEAKLWGQVASNIGPVPECRLLQVGDRLADVFEFMQDCQKLGHGFVIRAKHDRKVDDSSMKMQEKLDLQALSATRTQHVPRRGDRKARDAKVAVRWCSAQLSCPKYGSHDPSPLEEVQVVELIEPDPPEGTEALHWRLLTSEPVASEADAWLAVQRYRQRWVIEEWHKALKSGCKLESAQLKTADGIRRLAAVLGVVAVRLMQLRDAASAVEQGEREPAGNPLACPLSDPVWVRVIAAKAKVAPEEVDAAVLFKTLARHGGHLGRKHDPRPGWKCLWKGYRKISLMVEGVRCVEG